LLCHYHNIITGRAGVCEVHNTSESWPQYLGSASDDDICIDDPAIPVRAVRIVPSGRHLQVTALVSDCVRVRGSLIALGQHVRVDGAFEIGPVRVRIAFSDDERE
jgi:hypothetical protein